jgi:hypothetical protein
VTGTGREDRTATLDEDVAAGSAALNGMHSAVLRYGAIAALVAIRVPEQLRDGPVAVADLASRCGAHAPALERLLRTTASTGLVRTAGPGTYELTGAGQALLDGREARRLRWMAQPEMWATIGELTETVRTGQAPFIKRYGSTYDYLASRPEASAAFDALMTGVYDGVAARLAEADVFPGAGTVVDIGGGKGTLLAAVLRARPGLRGVLLDLQRSAGPAREYLADQGLAGRAEVTAGDFFAAVPSGGEAYLLAHVIHNWSDDECAAILRVVRAAMPGHGRLLVVDMVLPADDRPHWAKDLDIRMLATFEGKERTEAEITALLAGAGFRPGQVVDLGIGGECVIVASPATN